ncbi:MAG: aldehyde dehydrogenase family protein [Elusimicrobia bacterium]|nr:aldehyde dehydrogenase family protein [Elusimicrobiota bacterium]
MAVSGTILPGVSKEQVQERAAAARQAQTVWARYTLSERVRRLRAVWAEIDAARPRIVETIREETGKPVAEIETMEIDGVSLILTYFTRHAHRILKDRPVSKPWFFFNKRAYVRHVPRGIIGLITPWNMPFLIPVGDAVPALISGNAVLLKPSEWTPRSALIVEEIVKATGLLPEGLFQVIIGDGAVGAAVADESDMILFTGSTASGKKVARAAAERLKPVVLELGGKHPMIVLRDAPLERAVKAAVWGRFANSGQICVGVERVFVEEELYPRFTEAVAKEIKSLRQGEGGEDTDLGRLIFPRQLEVVQAHLEDARAKGARVTGGEIIDAEKLLVSPALVLDARPDMKVMSEETFGPVLAVMPVRSPEEALRLANDTPFGLAASVWSRDVARAEALSAFVEAGLVSVNDVLSHYVVCSLPFGGVKDSGLGRRHSDEGMRMFCQPQSVLVHEWPPNLPEMWWFPYSRMKTRLISWMTRFA